MIEGGHDAGRRARAHDGRFCARRTAGLLADFMKRVPSSQAPINAYLAEVKRSMTHGHGNPNAGGAAAAAFAARRHRCAEPARRLARRWLSGDADGG